MGMSSNSPPPSARNARMPAKGKATVTKAGLTGLASLRAPQARRFAPWAGTTSGASGSGRFGFSARPRMLQQAGLGATRVSHCADIG